MAVDVSCETIIHVPRDVVAEYASEPANAPEWYANIGAVEARTPPPARVGSQYAFVARFLGRELRYTYEIREWVPGERFVMSTEQGPFPMETTYVWHDVPGGATRMSIRNRGEPSGFASVAAPVMRAAMRRAMAKDLRAISRILEQRGERAVGHAGS